jgi:enterochelin esterase-like enzyme
MKNFWQSPVRTLRSMWRGKAPQVRHIRHMHSPTLDREVNIDIYLPHNYDRRSPQLWPLLILNDGQDLPRMNFAGILEHAYYTHNMPGIIAVGVYCSHDRIREYGTARQPDYKGRGDLANRYRSFILDELLPWLYSKFNISPDQADRAIAGFSLGGLSALDIGWSSPQTFSTVGVFSGSLWWRWSPVSDHNPDSDRIMHDIIRTSNDQRPTDQYFWFQVGDKDEEDDRNNNGVIDAIDDTIDCIRELQLRGYHSGQIRYLEVENGYHDPHTWGRAMPDFLLWTFTPDFGD